MPAVAGTSSIGAGVKTVSVAILAFTAVTLGLAGVASFVACDEEGPSETIWPDRLTADFCEELVEAAGDLEELCLSFDECAYAIAFSGEKPCVEVKIALDIVISEKCPGYEDELRSARERAFQEWLGKGR